MERGIKTFPFFLLWIKYTVFQHAFSRSWKTRKSKRQSKTFHPSLQSLEKERENCTIVMLGPSWLGQLKDSFLFIFNFFFFFFQWGQSSSPFFSANTIRNFQLLGCDSILPYTNRTVIAKLLGVKKEERRIETRSSFFQSRIKKPKSFPLVFLTVTSRNLRPCACKTKKSAANQGIVL